MPESSPQPATNPAKPARPAPALLTFGGLAAAFGVAACCGLPFILAGLGLGTAWLVGVALLVVGYLYV